MISYSGLTNYGKATLPSVGSWGINNNILRDPPKSIHTRRIDKVGQTSEITQMIDDSENRASEAILQFARGVNPMVSVSYDNFSNNGGQRSGAVYGGSGGEMTVGGQTQAYLPYRIMRGGVFRPPVVPARDLMPLSRQPRVWTSSFTKPGFVDFSKKAMTCGTAETTKEVKTNTLKASARPTAVYKMESPLKEPFEIKYMIQPVLNKSYQTTLSSTDRTNQVVLKPTKEINENNIHYFAKTNINDPSNYINNNEMDTKRYLQDTNSHEVYTNINDQSHYVNNNEMDTERYLQDTNSHEVNTNLGTHIQLNSIDEIFNTDNIRTKELINIDYVTPISGNEKTDYIHNDIELERVLPYHSSSTNIKHNQQKILEHEYMKEMERNIPLTNMHINPGKIGEHNVSSRNYNLTEKPNFGSFEGKAVIPSFNRTQNVQENYETDKSKFNKKVEQMFNRYRL